MMKVVLAVAACLLAVDAAPLPKKRHEKHCTGKCQEGDKNSRMHRMHLMEHKLAEHALCELEKRCPTPRPSASTVPCEGGQAGEYECSNVDQLAFVSLEDLGAGPTAGGNDIWGWTDPETGHEIAIMGTSDGTTFIDITDPREPAVLGRIETYTVSSLWRDIKVYNNHAYIGSEASGHGVQVFDLTNLRSLYGTDSRGADIRILREDAHYDEFGNSHNLAINEETGFVYAIGSGTCNGGPHIIDIRTPAEPLFVGCFDEDGYTHDAECVTYTGPDAEFQGREICFLYNENTLTIADVTDKENIQQIARETYDDVYYTHQGWLFEDQTHLVLDDEIDELSGPTPNTRTLIWNLESLRNPTLVDSFFSEETVSDHNQYTHRNHVWQSNYMAGLRILKIDQSSDVPVLSEVGFFDVAPGDDRPGFEGSWSNYPYFPSGVVVATSMERGLFILDPSAAMAQ